MGISGSGKSTVGARLARELGWRFVEGDEYHPEANIRKMRAGNPLTDADRDAWLDRLRAEIARGLAAGENLVLTSSALKESYRARLRVDPERVQFVFLHGDYELISSRLRDRRGHFASEKLLASQYEALEPPEGVLRVDAGMSVECAVRSIRDHLEA